MPSSAESRRWRLLHVLGLRSPDGLAEPIETPRLARFRLGYLRMSRRRPEHWSGPPSRTKEAVVGFADKFRNKAQELRGRIKRNTGKVTGNRGLQAEGRADEVKSNLKQVGEKVKDAFRRRGTRRQY
jgi:uncharacterized protein YjbJ (UPF0337 family)